MAVKKYSVDLTITEIVELAEFLKDKFNDEAYYALKSDDEVEENTWQVTSRTKARAKRVRASVLHETLTGEGLFDEADEAVAARNQAEARKAKAAEEATELHSVD